jgi:hypothetical protein
LSDTAQLLVIKIALLDDRPAAIAALDAIAAQLLRTDVTPVAGRGRALVTRGG